MTAPTDRTAEPPAVHAPAPPAGAGEPGLTVPPAVAPGPGSPPHVIGLDLSLTASGFASTLGWCELLGEDGITTMQLADRAAAVYRLACRIVDLAKSSDLVVLERPAAAQAYGGASERAGLFWLVVVKLRAIDIPVAEVTPGTLKQYATGKGQGDKGAVIDAVARRWPMFQTGGNNNIADAVVLAAMGADQYGQSLAVMPSINRAALKKIEWPERIGS